MVTYLNSLFLIIVCNIDAIADEIKKSVIVFVVLLYDGARGLSVSHCDVRFRTILHLLWRVDYRRIYLSVITICGSPVHDLRVLYTVGAQVRHSHLLYLVVRPVVRSETF